MTSLPNLSSRRSGLASRFAFLTRWFRRQDNSYGERYGFDASSSSQNADADALDDPDAPTTGNGNGHGHGDGPDHDHEPPRRSLLRRRPGGSRERSIAQLQQAYEEVFDLVGTLKQHMEAQSHRSERLIEMMEGLPEALKSLPEANRNQTQTLQVIEGHLKQQNLQSEGLTQAIQGLAKAAGNQEHAMNLIQQQLDAGQESREQLHQNFSHLGETLEQMTETHQASTQLLTRLNDTHEQSDVQMQQLVARNQRQMTMMSVVSWSLAIVALTVAGAVAIWVGQQINGTSGSADAGGAQTAGFVAPASTNDTARDETTAASQTSADADATTAATTTTDADAAAQATVQGAAQDAAADQTSGDGSVADESTADASAASDAPTDASTDAPIEAVPWLPTFDAHASIVESLEALEAMAPHADATDE